MTNQKPIEPLLSRELVEQWHDDALESDPSITVAEFIATKALQWGADQNFEAIIRRLVSGPYGASVATSDLIADLRAAFNKPFNKPATQSTRLHSYKIGTGAIDLASVNPNDFVSVNPSQHAPSSPATASSKLPPNSHPTPFFTMTDSNSIAPPLELVQQWTKEASNLWYTVTQSCEYIATQAARWGYTQRGAINEAELQRARDEELEAVIAWMMKMGIWGYDGKAIPALRAARRPRPKSQAEQALEALNEAVYMADDMPPEGISTDQAATIRAALERLRKLEEGQ